MPIHPENGGEQWGNHGKVYHGPDAKEKAAKQAAAAHANGWRGDDAVGPIYAGILFVDEGKVFLCHRTDKDEWEGPGGHIEPGETPENAARRETYEEIGRDVSPDDLSQPVEQDEKYTAFIVNSGFQFDAKLNHEHDCYHWFPLDDLPDATHPNIKEWAKGMMHRADAQSTPDPTTELDIAKAIRDGKLPSPQRLDHVWLFDLRVTGTGVAYRASLDEWVYRPPEYYLNDEFLERCQGLPVLFDHPDKGLTDTDEWRQRAIGALVLPYIPANDDEFHATNEVWAIARIYDDDAAELMLETHISTSPAVEFGGKQDLNYTRTEDGGRMLIESKPEYLDHLAVVKGVDGAGGGVWDKLGAPRGVAQ